MNNGMRIMAVVASLMVGAAGIPGANAQALQESERSMLLPQNADIAQGRVLAEDACADCHGLDGISIDPTLPHLAGQHVIYLYDELNAYRERRREDEPMRKALEFLSDDALRKVSIYYASLVPPEPAASIAGEEGAEPVVSDDPAQLGKAAAASCGGCHGADGNSGIPGMPNLTAQSPEYFAAAMRAYQNGDRQGGMMNALVSGIDEESIQNMGLYYALQEPRRTSADGGGDVESGRASAQSCAGCHGADGNIAAADMPTLAGQDPGYLAASLRAYAQGQREHAQMTNASIELTDAEIENMSAFYARQEPIARNIRSPLTVAEWIERCDRCHGIGGNSTNPRYPSLASQNDRYLARVTKLYADGGRPNSSMAAMSQPLGPADIEAIAAYYAAQPRKSILYVELPCTTAED